MGIPSHFLEWLQGFAKDRTAKEPIRLLNHLHSSFPATVTNQPDESDTLPALLRRCAEVCQRAESMVRRLDPGRNAFLTENLGDVARQMELILGVLGIDDSNPSGRDGRPGLLRRFFQRTQAQIPGEGEFEAPDFDVSRQGFQGNSWSVPISELLSFLAFSRKTGVLWVDTPEENFLLGLSDGLLMHASSDRTPEGLRLGEIMVGFGYLTRRQLDRFISGLEGTPGSAMGESLLASGLVTQDELHRTLAYQVQQLVNRLVNTTHAIFRFREGFEVPHAHQVRLNINQVLLTSARVQDESVNPEIRDHSVQQDWDSWTQNLADQMSGVTQWAEAADGPESAEDSTQPADEDSQPGLERTPSLLTQTTSEIESEWQDDEDADTDEADLGSEEAQAHEDVDAASDASDAGEANPHTHPPHRAHGGRLKSKKRQRRAG